MFRLEPVGRHSVEVCTNVSCAVSGAQQVRRGARARARDRRRRDDRGRQRHAARRRVPRRLRLGDRRRRRQPAPPARAARATCPRIVKELARVSAAPEVVFAGTDGGALTDLAEYEAVGGLHRAAPRARDDAGRDHRRARRVEPARPRRRVLPDRAQVELRPEARPEPAAPLPRRQRGRVRARHVQGPRDHAPRPVPLPRGLPDRRARDRVEARVRLHPRRVRARVRGARLGARADAQGEAARRRDDRPPPRRRRLHLRRGDRAARVARGPARPAADEAAVPGDRGPLRLADRGQQRRVDHDRDADHRDGRRGVREARRRELDRHAGLLALRQRRATAATTSCRTATRSAT